MNLTNIIKYTKDLLADKYKTFDTRFYKECIEYLDNDSHIEQFIESHNIDNKYLLEPLKLYIWSKFDSFNCYLADASILDNKMIKDNCIYRDLSIINEKTKSNLLRQLYVIETDNLNNFFKDSLEYYAHIDNIVFVISENMIDNDKIIKLTKKSSLNLFMGTEVLYFLEKQDLDRFIGYMKNDNKYVVNAVNMFKTIYELFKLLEKTNERLYCRLIIFSGLILQSLGTSYTKDADIILWAKNMEENNVDKAKEMLNNYKEIDLLIYDNSHFNLEHFGNMLTDPDKHYYFLGIKMTRIFTFLRRTYTRPYPASFVDIIMLDKINNIKIPACFPILASVSNSKIVIYTKKTIYEYLNKVQILLKEWHNIDYGIDKLKKIIRSCKNYPNDPPFHETIKEDTFTFPIENILDDSIYILINKYFNVDKNLLVIDDAKEYPKYYPKNNNMITVIEPAGSDISKLFMQMTKEKNKKNYQMFISDFTSDTFITLEHKYSSLLFKYNIHSIINHMDIVHMNINKYCTNDLTIMIIYLDGTYVDMAISKTGKYEILDDNKLKFGIYRFDDYYDLKNNKYKQVVVYLKDTLRYAYGIVEKVIVQQDIINAFGSDYQIINDDRLINIVPDELLNELSEQQKSITSIFRYMILKKN